MSRDYKARHRKSTGFSGWTGLGLGLSLGLAVAVFVYLRDHRTDAPPAHAVRAAKKIHGNDPLDADGGDAGAAAAPAKSYDFYDMLPKFEVVVPEKDKVVKHDIHPVPETRRGTYVLQAGSYKNIADAERTRAQLALQGVDAKIQKVTVDNDSWLRVRIGPISNLDELNHLRQVLRKADIDVLVIQVGD
ncbi:MAG: SPOR domain-containing protein [Steroidobacterales bacterium]